MKKLLFLATLALGLAACTSEEDVMEQSASAQISLQGVTKKATRGGLDQSTLTAATDIYCSGLLHGSNTSFHFQNAKFTNSGTQNTWSSVATWPLDGTMDFWAYCSSDYLRGTGVDGDGNPIQTTSTVNRVTPVTATFATSGSAASDSYQSLTLDFADRLTGSTDVMVSNIVSKNCSTHETPTLIFRHAMAWIVVAIQLDNNNTASDLMKFYEVTLNGVKLSGSMTATASSVTGSTNWGSKDVAWDPVWTPYQVDGTDVTTNKAFPAYTSTEGVMLGNALSDPVEGIMVLPQAQTSITIKYAYKDINGNYNNVLSHTIDLTNDAENTYPDWQAGHKYTYTLTINPSDSSKTIYLTSSVVTYENESYPFTL